MVVKQWDCRVHCWNCNYNDLRSTFHCKRWTVKWKQPLYELREVFFLKKPWVMFSYYFWINILVIFIIWPNLSCRSQGPRRLRRRCAVSGTLRLWVRIPPGAYMCVCCECCVLSGRGLCVELITRPEKYYWLWCVVVCDLETSWMRRPWPTGEGGGCRAKKHSLSCSGIFWNLYWNTLIMYLVH